MNVRIKIFFVWAALMLAISVYLRFQFVPYDDSEVVSAIESNIQTELLQLQREAIAVSKSIEGGKEWPKTNFAFFLHDSTGVIKWSDHHYYPEPIISVSDSVVYVRSGSSHFLSKQIRIGLKQYLTGYVPLQTSFPIQNQFLSSVQNSNIFSLPGVSLSLSGNVYPVVYNGRNQFLISINPQLSKHKPFEILSWVSFSIGVIFLFWASYRLINKLLINRHELISAFLILFFLLGLRLFMVYGKFPGSGIWLDIFNPTLFASSSFNDSIGNLFFNTVALLLVSISFFYFLRGSRFISWRRRADFFKVLVAALFLVFCFASQLLPFLYFETLYHNSSINPDFSVQLFFDSVGLLALGCIILSTAAGGFLLVTFFRTCIRITHSNWKLFFSGLIIALIIVAGYHFATKRDYEVPIILATINLLVLFFTTTVKSFKFISSQSLALVLFLLVIFSLQAAISIRYLSRDRQKEAMIKFGNSFIIERDFLGEYLLDQSISKIEGDEFIKQQMLNPFKRIQSISHKIRQSHLNSYFDRYDIRIYLFDNRGKTVGDEMVDLKTLTDDFVPLAQNTNYRGIYFIDHPVATGQSLESNRDEQFLKRYLAIIPIRFHLTGYIALDLTLRKILPVTVFPKLLLDSRFSDYSSSSNYSFAIFNKGALINSSGPFSYKTSRLLDCTADEELFKYGLTIDGFYHVGIHGAKGQAAIISSPQYSTFNLMANFSFYFLISLTLVLIFFLLLKLKSIKGMQLSYSNRIQFYVYLATVLPLVVVTITTLRINSKSEEARMEADSAGKAVRIAKSVASLLSGDRADLQKELLRQAQSAGVDATVFAKDGMLMVSSQPGIFSNQLVSKLLNPEALKRVLNGEDLFALNDQIGYLKFRNTYSVIRSSVNNEVMAILSLPFFESQELSERNQIQLISNILVVFVFVLLFFYLTSFIALNWLTAPLRTIASSLSRTTLSGENRKLSWSSKDEIGSMVSEYNTMVDNLIKSREELEKKQRETAWREMARQVAHEIKNPLTPIKLTLQQLEKTVQEGRAVPEKTIQSLKSVLHQVEILNDIASSFSAFAQMPELNLERLNLETLLTDAVSLFNDSHDGKVFMGSIEKEAMIMGDRKLFSRIFSNIILNGLQSERANEKIMIEIGVTLHNTNWVIFFKDNGKGMSSETIDKIFIPYFSTKESGSGLGLAIAKQGIEQAGGRIWCESQVNQGTTFYVSLPSV
jgi:two-component system, NtrC family, nitrogen regulation sensor histidine kinase NtrY